MDKISIILKPTFWRLLIWRIFPGLIIVGIAVLISVTTPAASFVKAFSTRMIPSLLGILTAQILMSLYEWINKSSYIEIAEGEITGSKTAVFSRSQKIHLRDLARTELAPIK